ncbi:MAG: AAA-like domain-containing protein [Desulfobacteraceae bacterium]|jgi:GAF domain-containing protein|nr:AAA-like domain-containing protein [Desulfobacteraceae bacterium]
MDSNPNTYFEVWGTLSADSPNYIRRSADDLIIEHLSAGRFCYVLTARQMGKSSLLTQTKHELELKGAKCVEIDLSALVDSSMTTERFYNSLLYLLCKHLEIKTDLTDWRQDKDNLLYTHKFSTFLEDIILRKATSPIIILIDEIDSLLRPQNFKADDFFTLIRSYYNARADNPCFKKLAFALFGSARPDDLMTDKERTPFNIGERIDLDYFTLEETMKFKEGFKDLPVDAEALLEEIYDWTEGHPFITQAMCGEFVNSDFKEGEDIKSFLYQIVSKLLSPEDTFYRHFDHIEDRINDKENYKFQMIDILKKIIFNETVEHDPRSPEQIYLKLSGLVKPDEYGKLALSNRIYKRVFNQEWLRNNQHKLGRPLDEAIENWLLSGKSEAALLPAEKLDSFLDWAEKQDHLTSLEREFLNASRKPAIDESKFDLSHAHLLLEALGKIDKVTRNLFRLEKTLKNTSDIIQSPPLNFEYAAIQLIRSEESVIETVYGTGVASEWTGLAKHYLDKDRKLRDIQADVFETGFTEIITGWDDRFDLFVYKKFEHEKFVRVFTPIFLVWDLATGNPVKEWFKYCKWNILPIKDSNQEGKKGRLITLEMQMAEILKEKNWEMETIGTVETGYRNPEAVITPEEAIELSRTLSIQALEIRKALLPYALESIAENALKIVGADSASFHFYSGDKPNNYFFEAGAGSIGKKFLKEFQPRSGGLGRQAILSKKPRFIPDYARGHSELELNKFNPRIFGEGIRAIAAFPVNISDWEGVLYVHFHEVHWFTEDEIKLLQYFADRAADAIRHTLAYLKMHDKSIQLSSLNAIANSLSNARKENLLEEIAWNSLNVLAADVVTIYEYFESEKRFDVPPKIAGRLLAKQLMQTEIRKDDAPLLILAKGTNVYAGAARGNEIMNKPSQHRSKRKRKPFVARENIKSSAGILLRVNSETVGIMFVNYRRFHNFTEDEKSIIEALASSAAVAIKNSRVVGES